AAIRTLAVVVQGVERKRRRINDVQLVVRPEDDRAGADVPRPQPRDLRAHIVLRRALRHGERLPVDEDALVLGDGASGLRPGDRQARHARHQGEHNHDRRSAPRSFHLTPPAWNLVFWMSDFAWSGQDNLDLDQLRPSDTTWAKYSFGFCLIPPHLTE